MVYKSKNKFFKFIDFAACSFIIIMAISFSSCSDDNPVKPTQVTSEIIDSSIFDWQFVECTPYTMSDMYVADTNKLFFASLPNLIIYDGKQIINIGGLSQYYYPQVVNGFDENNVFFAGKYSIGTGLCMPWLKKWNGSSIKDILMPQDTVGNGVMDIYVNGPSDIWISVYPARIYHYNGTITTYTPDNPNISFSYFFKDQDGVLYCNGVITITLDKCIYESFRWDNNTWNIYSVDTVINKVTALQSYTFLCGSDLLRSGANSLYYFNNEKWDNFISTDGFWVDCVGGSSKSSFLSSILINNTSPYQLYYCNGTKWFSQKNFQPPLDVLFERIIRIKQYKSLYYGIFDNYTINNYFFIGRPKK